MGIEMKTNWLSSAKEDKEKIKKEIPKELPKLKNFPEPKKHLDMVKIEPFYSLKRWSNEWKLIMSRRKCVAINFEYDNGDFGTFIVVEKEGGFTYLDREYCFDDSLKYYNYDFKMYCYDFHQSLSMPIKRKINIKKIKDSLTASQLDDIEFATNPSTLKKFLISKVIEMILKGAELDRWMRMMFWICLFTLIAGVITLLILLGHTGVFSKIAQGAKPPA
jgi:hypothetical protein